MLIPVGNPDEKRLAEGDGNVGAGVEAHLIERGGAFGALLLLSGIDRERTNVGSNRHAAAGLWMLEDIESKRELRPVGLTDGRFGIRHHSEDHRSCRYELETVDGNGRFQDAANLILGLARVGRDRRSELDEKHRACGDLVVGWRRLVGSGTGRQRDEEAQSSEGTRVVVQGNGLQIAHPLQPKYRDRHLSRQG